MQFSVMAALLASDVGAHAIRFTAAMTAIIVIAFLYFFPSLIAMSRHKRNIASIVVLNLFLGFTIVGWVLSLVWAFAVDRQEEPKTYTSEPQAYNSPRYEPVPQRPIGLPTWAVASLFAFTVLGLIYLFTSYKDNFQATRVSCRVCVTFNGRRDCRTASAVTQQEAVRTAVSNSCALLAAGVTETTRCKNTRPDSVDWLR